MFKVSRAKLRLNSPDLKVMERALIAFCLGKNEIVL